MIEAEALLPMIYVTESNYNLEVMKFYFKEKWTKDIYETCRNGYSEMSEINLNLAEIGIEHYIKDLKLYEARLIGRELL